jgi:hypothetical protein
LDTSDAGKKAVACALVALNQFEDKKRKKEDEKYRSGYGMTFMTGWPDLAKQVKYNRFYSMLIKYFSCF